MFRILLSVALLPALIVSLSSVTTADEAGVVGARSVGTPVAQIDPGQAASKEIVRYQLTDWKTKHIHDAKKAETIEKTLKKLGCELKTNEHNGHIDVRYRCPKWHQLELKSHEDAHKWEKWLQEFGFKTEHKH